MHGFNECGQSFHKNNKVTKQERNKSACVAGITYIYVICCMHEWNVLKLLGLNDDMIFIFNFILGMFGSKLIYKHLC